MRKIKTIAFETEAKRLYLLAKEILYIQAKGHDCHVYTVSGNCYIIRLTMSQCARIIDESTCFVSSDFVLLGRNLIINYSRLAKCSFNNAEIPLRKATKDGQEEIVAVKCQTQAWKRFISLLRQGDAALTQYQADKRQEYMSANQPPNCSLIGFMTTASVAKSDFYNLTNQNDFLLLGGCDASPIYSEGTMESKLKEIANWANETVSTINENIRRQPTTLVNRAFDANDEPKFDVVLSYEEYWTVSPVAKPSERLKALQKKFNESYDANLQKIISDSEDKKNDDKKRSESLESLGMYDYIRAMDRISRELSEQGDHPSCYRSRPLGQYRYKGRNKRPEIVLFLKNIYDAEQSWHRGYYDNQLPTLNELVKLTYIHELMHAVMHSKTSYSYIEEPLAEMGMLCFVHDALQDKGLEKKALYWVKQKQNHEPICHYGFGAFLYNSLCDAEVGWGVGNLMKQYIRVNKKLSEKDATLSDYEDYFLGGYPWNNLQKSALDKLFVVLGTTRIKKTIRKSKDEEEILFKWESEAYKRKIEEFQQRVEEKIKNDEKNQGSSFWDDEENEIIATKSIREIVHINIQQYKVYLGFNEIESSSNALTFERKTSRYCQDIYVDYLLKKLNDADFVREILRSSGAIVLNRTTEGKYYRYELKIGF